MTEASKEFDQVDQTGNDTVFDEMVKREVRSRLVARILFWLIYSIFGSGLCYLCFSMTISFLVNGQVFEFIQGIVVSLPMMGFVYMAHNLDTKNMYLYSPAEHVRRGFTCR